jgi:hypothetical protein
VGNFPHPSLASLEGSITYQWHASQLPHPHPTSDPQPTLRISSGRLNPGPLVPVCMQPDIQPQVG